MRRLRMWWPRDRRQAQSGATLVELLVSIVIMGLALTIVIGTFSTGLLDSALEKRNTAATAVVQYELDQIGGSPYNSPPQSYSDCFATENASVAPRTVGYKGSCSSSVYTLRADVQIVSMPSPSTQLWSIAVISWPNGAPVGKQPVETIKVSR
jgi:type II secretory pathway pseudopilin PulG